MQMAGILSAIFDPIMRPLLMVPPVVSVLIIAAAIALLTTIVYKLVTDQHVMKSLREEMQKSREKMKKFKDDPDKMLKIQKQAMDKQMQYMMQSFKPTFITFLPIILIFGWLNANIAFQPVMPGEAFEVSALVADDATGNISLSTQPEGIRFESPQVQSIKEGKSIWILEGDPGEYVLTYTHDDQVATQDLVITEDQRYADPRVEPDNPVFEELVIGNEKTVLFEVFGFRVGWLMGYIIFIMIFSTALRKILKVH